MTRVVGKQVDDPRTKYNRLSLSVSQNIALSTLSAATINSQSTSALFGGSDKDLTPRVTSTATEPFVIGAGTIGVRIDSGSTVSVPILNTDNTVGLIAKKINAAVGATVAFWLEGKLQIKSNGIAGPTGTLQLSNIAGTILNVLGIAATTYVGVGENTRGIITLSDDNFGGYVPLRIAGKQSLVTNAGNFVLTSDDTIDLNYNPVTPGGAPIHGRLSWNGSNYILGYYASLPANAEINTLGANLTIIDTADQLTITVVANGKSRNFVFSFLAGPSTQDTTIDRINERWGNLLGVPNARVFVRGAVSQPYTFNTEIVHVAVNGGAEVPVTLAPSDVTVANVITKFSAVPGLTATSVNTGSGIILQLTTTTGVGYKSSISLRDDTSNNGHHALAKLGLAAGTYTGPYIAKPRGSFEITFFAPNRGSRSSLTIVTDGPVTTARLGLPADNTTVTASNNEVDISVSLPELADYGRDPTAAVPELTTYQVEAVFPEVLSFGEIPTDYVSEAEEFSGDSTNANNDPRRDFALFNTINVPFGFANKARNAGQVVTVGPDGLVDIGQMRKSTDLLMRYFKQILTADFHTGGVTGVLANVFATTGSFGNPLPASATMDLRVDPQALAGGTRKLTISIGGASPSEYEFAVGLMTGRGAIDLGSSITNISASRITPRAITHIVRSGSILDRSLVQQFVASGTNLITRIYAQVDTFNFSSYEVTTNCAWDSSGVNWVKDIPAVAASFFGNGGLISGIRYRKQTASVATFTEAEWIDAFQFPLSASAGFENSFARNLRLGQEYADSGTDASAEIARVIVPTNVGNRRTLIWQSETASFTNVRVYFVNGSIHGGSDNAGIEITYNARWTESTLRWNRDLNNQAVKFFLGDRAFSFQNTGSQPPSTWDDTESATGWLSSGGSFQPTGFYWYGNTNPSAFFQMPGPVTFLQNELSLPVLNSLYANLIPKMYGHVKVDAGVIDFANTTIIGSGGISISGSSLDIAPNFVPDDPDRMITLATISGNSNGLSAINITTTQAATFVRFNIRNSAGNNVTWASQSVLRFDFITYFDVTP
jgi:hypothetical protein